MPRAATRRVATTIAQECLVMRARKVARALTRVYEEEMRGHGATVAQVNILVAIGVGGALRPAVLIDALDLEKSTLSRNLRGLEDAGWVTLERDAGSGKGGQVIRLTDAGEQLLHDLLPAWRRAQARARQILRADLRDALEES